MNSAIELLNSRYSGMHWEGLDLHLSLSVAYILKTAGTPGCDPGSAWSQEADLVLHEARLDAAENAAAADAICAAQLELDGEPQDMVPIPPPPRAPALLTLHLHGGGLVTATGNRLSVRLFGKALFLEKV